MAAPMKLCASSPGRHRRSMVASPDRRAIHRNSWPAASNSTRTKPGGAISTRGRADDIRLWYDADDVPFLREDEKDAAEIAKVRAETISTLITAGYEPDSVVAAVDADTEILSSGGTDRSIGNNLLSIQNAANAAD